MRSQYTSFLLHVVAFRREISLTVLSNGRTTLAAGAPREFTAISARFRNSGRVA
jgi:hypothetical protein